MSKIKYLITSESKERLAEAVAKSTNFMDIYRNLGFDDKRNVYGWERQRLKQLLGKYEISYEHFTARKSKGEQQPERPLEELLVFGTNAQSGLLKRRLIGAGLLEYKCSVCGIVDWNGQKLTLQLDHIDGCPKNNVIENLRILCPNCHSQTKTYGGKNRDGRNPTVCACGGTKTSDSTQCRACWAKVAAGNPTIAWPETDVLCKLLQEQGSPETAKELGCTTKAIRRRLVKLGINYGDLVRHHNQIWHGLDDLTSETQGASNPGISEVNLEILSRTVD